jgi:hypothetical protein
VALIAAFLSLSACRLDVGVDVAMTADGSGTVTVTAVADAELLAKVPGALADLRLDDLRTGGWAAEGPAAADGGAQRLVLRKPFATPDQASTVLGELSGPGGPLRAVSVEWRRTFGTVRSGVAVTAQLDGGLAALGDAELAQALGGRVGLADRVTGDVADGLKLSVTARLPGEVADSNGTVGADGTSVTWTPDLRGGAVTELRASFVERDSGALSARTRGRWARIGLAVWAALMVVLVAAIAVYVRASRRRRPRDR